MTSVYYISPSVLPSRSANSIHVVHQCGGFAAVGAAVTLVAMRSISDADLLPAEVEAAYGVQDPHLHFDTFTSRMSRGINLRIAAHALVRLRSAAPFPDIIHSRNLYASYVLAEISRLPIIVEIHDIETGLRRHLQRAVMIRPNVLTIVISEKLQQVLAEHHGVAPRHAVVLHDAAPDGIRPLPLADKRGRLQALVPDLSLRSCRLVCGYFGQLYAGRGIEIIEAMARARPGDGFLVFGGNEADIVARRDSNQISNLHYVGFVPHAAAQQAMAACDVLLMPYQRSVSIGVEGRDTARWMSPMKMFEYLASGTPIISSDLPVLHEVLDDGKTALLARPDDPSHWLDHLDRLACNGDLGRTIGADAHRLYRRSHNWTARARAILDAARDQ